MENEENNDREKKVDLSDNSTISQEFEIHNKQWDDNHALIHDAVVKLMLSLKRRPKYEEIKKETGLGLDTIAKHYKQLKFNPQNHPLRVLTDDVIISIANSSRKGSSRSQELWMRLFEGFTDKVQVNQNVNFVKRPPWMKDESDKSKPKLPTE